MTFAFTSGNPDNLTSGNAASMTDIQGPFYDIRAYLNSPAVPPPTPGWTYPLSAQQVGDVGMLNQIRAGRQLTVADFTSMGLMQPVGLFNLSGLTNLGSGGALSNKGSVPFGVGINGAASTAAQFAGSTAQALYIADTAVATDPYRIRTGSFGCWFRTAKRALEQALLSKFLATGNQRAWLLELNVNNLAGFYVSSDGTNIAGPVGVSDVCDDRWHQMVATFDGTTARLYVDGVLEGVTSLAMTLFGATAPLNVGAIGADSGVAAGLPFYGRVDEAFVTPDILTDDQIRLLYCARIPHTLGVQALRSSLNVRRRRRGGTLATTDFPSTPVRLHNFTAGALTDEGTGAVPLTNNNPTLILPVAGADGDGETPNTSGNAFSFGGAHTGLSATDAGLPSGTNARSYGAWFKTTNTSGNSAIIAWGTLPSNRTIFFDSVGALANVSGTDQILGGFIADGQWHHIVAVEDNAAGDGLRRKVYLDGRCVTMSTVLASITLAGANRFRVGADVDGTLPFVGQIDGAFVHSVALTTEQVLALYAKGSMSLGVSPKNPGDHIEAMDTSNVLATFDTLDSTVTVDLGVAA